MKTCKRFLIGSLIALLCTLSAGLWLSSAQARPGGGHSSSGHSSSGGRSSRSSSGSYRSSGSSWGGSSWSSSSGSSYSSGGSSMTELEFFFLLLVIVTLYVIYINMRSSGRQTISSAPTESVKNWQSDQLTSQFATLKSLDENFSIILLMDFVHSLYCKLYGYTGKPEFSWLSPFIDPDVLSRVEQMLPGNSIDEVVVNGLHWQEINLNDAQQISIVLVIDANYTLHQQNKSTRYTVTERWKLSRNQGLLSQEPKKMQSLSCPYCAAPAHFNEAGVCPYCKNVLQQGEVQWYVKQRAIVQISAFDAVDLVSYAQEQGTELLTVKANDLVEQQAQFQQLHQIPDWDSYWQNWQTDIVQAYFMEIYQHWSQRNWSGVRHLLSDRLYESNQFWTDRYQQQNWFNRLDSLKIQRIVLAKIDLDKFYEAITVRIFASCYDYTVDVQGKIIGGSKNNLRQYSEYWTFVRRIGVDQQQGKISLTQCPHCGAAADKMGQAGECGYCGSKISTGEFSWVLFLIMQDDVYSG